MIEFALRHLSLSDEEKQNHETLLDTLAAWTHEAPERPTLRTILERGGDAMQDIDVLTFNTSQQAKGYPTDATKVVNAARTGYVIARGLGPDHNVGDTNTEYRRDLGAMGQWMLKNRRGTLHDVTDGDVTDFKQAHPDQYPNIVAAIDKLRFRQQLRKISGRDTQELTPEEQEFRDRLDHLLMDFDGALLLQQEQDDSQ